MPQGSAGTVPSATVSIGLGLSFDAGEEWLAGILIAEGVRPVVPRCGAGMRVRGHGYRASP